MAMRVFKPVATVCVTLVLALVGATSVHAEVHNSFVSGFEFRFTLTQGSFGGAATADGESGLSGIWRIDVDHTRLDPCVSAGPCAAITGGNFSFLVTSPSTQHVQGNFDNPDEVPEGQPNVIELTNAGLPCNNQVFSIKDGLRNVGVGAGRNGSGSFDATLTHLRHGFFGRCITYSAIVSGTVVVDY